tara:strand:+ start:25901 stop:26710 length:810 start_codon:yes stop_codon:yes gene_type:complete
MSDTHLFSDRRISEDCISDLQLDQIAVGELEGTDEGRLAEKHLEGCSSCSKRLLSFREEMQSFPDDIFLQGMVAKTHRAVNAQQGHTRRWQAAAGILVAAAAVLLWIGSSAPKTARTSSEARPGSERSKGSLAIEVIVRHADGQVEAIVPGQVLHPEESIRFRISNQEPGYLTIIGVDSAQQVSHYSPEGKPIRMKAGRKQVIDGSIILDASEGAERVFALLCQSSPELSVLEAAVAAGLQAAGGHPQDIGRLEVECQQTSMWFSKSQP